MERRFYFIVGDILTCCLAGGASAWLVWLVVPGDWHSFAGMVIGMVLGMTAGMLCFFLSSPFFGAMEVMLPAMLAGMMAGMVVGMAVPMTGIGGIDAIETGGATGLACLAFSYLLQARLSGVVHDE